MTVTDQLNAYLLNNNSYIEILSSSVHILSYFFVTGALTFGNVGIAMLEPSLPLWMIFKMSPSKWELGM